MESFQRGKCIGRGSFGTVSIGVSKSDGLVFAVKSVDIATCLPGQAEALENEIHILRSISSPDIVKYLGDDETASSRNLHLEYMPGGTVVDFADVDESTVRSRTWCVVSALKYIHSKGIVHCDVKGKNVLVGTSSNQAKLADFGSSMVLSDTCRGKITPRGSPMWMAPEVIRAEYQGPESDVWSLGCTVVEMITGKAAWEDEGIDTLSRIGFSGRVPEFPTRMSETGRDFLDKCLRRDWRERWSCDQLLRHPFLAAVSPPNTVEDSPRCVLDWVNSEFEDDEEEDYEVSSHVFSAKERIGKLASGSGANWEFSDGWTVVRGSSSLVQVESTETGAISREEETGLEYSDFEGVVSECEVWSGGDLVERARNECDRVGSSGGWMSEPSVVEYSAVERSLDMLRKTWCNYYYYYCCMCNLCIFIKVLLSSSYSFGIFKNKLLVFNFYDVLYFFYLSCHDFLRFWRLNKSTELKYPGAL